jgi:hypothetical protein
MRFKFSRFIVNVVNFCERKYRKIHVVLVNRINLFQYEVWFVRV